MLQSFGQYTSYEFNVEFKDPLKGLEAQEKKAQYQELYQKGITPVPITNNEETSSQKRLILPGALINYKGKELVVQILQGEIAISNTQAIENSMSKLEYNFASALRRMNQTKKARLGFIHGHGELEPIDVMDFVKSIANFYDIEPIELPKVTKIPKIFDLVIVAKPQKSFNEFEKFKLDQYIMNGGKMIWLIDGVIAEMDSLGKEAAFLAPKNELGLDDLFFNYGVRINADLIQDLLCVPHPFVTGYVGEVPQQELMPWFFYPMAMPQSDHPIVSNMDACLFRFCSSIDTIENPELKKTILLNSSKYTRILPAPSRVNLSVLKHRPEPAMFNKPNQSLAVLVEGAFKSLYSNRVNNKFIKNLRDSVDLEYRDTSPKTSMVFISDGDIIKNEIDKRGNMFPLGFYKYTQKTFSNNDLLTNAVDYLCDSTGTVQLNARDIQLRPLDNNRAKLEAGKWKFINLVIPIILIILGGLIYNLIRIKKFKGKI
jgi:ABC-2 type transport system permease protein